METYQDRIRQLEQENECLKKALANAISEKNALSVFVETLIEHYHPDIKNITKAFCNKPAFEEIA